MKITQSQIQKIRLTEISGLDPVDVMIENHEPGKGRITIRCAGDVWTAYWGSMGGGSTVQAFFTNCSPCYLAGNLSSGIRRTITDTDAIEDHIKRRVIKMRIDGDLTADDARDLYDEAHLYQSVEALHFWDRAVEILGDDWWFDLPERQNPAYEYLCRVIAAVQEGLRLAASMDVTVNSNQ